MAYHFDRLVREGKAKNFAQIARVTGMSRARVTQMLNLMWLRIDIQDEIVNFIQHIIPKHALRFY